MTESGALYTAFRFLTDIGRVNLAAENADDLVFRVLGLFGKGEVFGFVIRPRAGAGGELIFSVCGKNHLDGVDVICSGCGRSRRRSRIVYPEIVITVMNVHA